MIFVLQALGYGMGVLLLFMVVRALLTGVFMSPRRATFGDYRGAIAVRRDERPAAYWVCVGGYLAFGVGAIAGTWWAFSQIRPVPVDDVTRPALLRLQAGEPGARVHALEVLGSGNLEGRAELVLMLEGKPVRTEALEGKVAFRWALDWYSPEAEVHYRPLDVRGGRLELQARFRTL